MEGKYDLFTKVSDRRDIVDFVREIEKYPCLYDKTLPEYANKVHNRRAWSTIAKKINTTGNISLICTYDNWFSMELNRF